ncbi:alpha/beta hydrolase [Dyella dinghuensis]|uniref:Alpha/beta hydrolase n=1 Tax=Dyella dinghuensis TaxID=1920169 RepID=A0A3S0RDK9_9GAMM|nr:alpha/beta hydrolase [Dyella dinghuensis]RUL63244.1 alpha/beta hydrolase [Dyella dinghuensis]
MTVVGSARYRLLRVLAVLLITIVIAAAALFVAFKCSPWPSVLLIRREFSRSGIESDAALSHRVPPGIRTQAAIQYDPSDPSALLDIYRPAALDGRALPVVFWIHGGGYIAGSRTEMANYARILAAGGYAVVAVDYPLAPEHPYPVPVVALNRALTFLSDNATRLKLDRNQFVLAGDSAGAQLAAQVALLVSSPDYAKATGMHPGIARSQLLGTVLFCGPYDGRAIVSEASSSWLARAFVWSYLGSPNPPVSTLDVFSVASHVTPEFPASFISVGNVDALAAQSYALADALRHQGVHVETLFYPASYKPPLDHEYQFDLTLPESNDALKQTQAFLLELTTHKNSP